MKLFDKIKSYFVTLREADVPEEPDKILYLCDRKACPRCSYPMCKHTTDVYHARNFERIDDIFVEGTVEERK